MLIKFLIHLKSDFRINLDLCVEKEGLKQEIEEKMKLLEDAYIALDSIEREKERDREMYEMEIDKLRRQPEFRYLRQTFLILLA